MPVSNQQKLAEKRKDLKILIEDKEKEKDRETKGSPHYCELDAKIRMARQWIVWIDNLMEVDEKEDSREIITEDGTKARKILREFVENDGTKSYHLLMKDGTKEWWSEDRVTIKE